MKNKYRDSDGNFYFLVDRTSKYVYLRSESSHTDSLGERFSIRDFNKSFERVETDKKFYKKLDDESKIVLDLIEKNKGSFIKNVSSSNNPWNASGLSIQNLIGITKENSKMSSDVGNIELKVQKNTRSTHNAPMALFTMAPKCFSTKVPKNKSVSRYLADKYGYSDKTYPDVNCLSVNFMTKKYTKKGDYEFKLKVNDNDKRVYLVVRKAKTKRIVTSKDFGYDFKDIYKRIDNKMKNVLLVSYENQKIKSSEYFELKHSWLYLGLNKKKAIDLIKDGKIFLNTGVDVKKNFKDKKQNGKVHDHGSEFRLKSNELKSLYKTVENLY
jgi:hypothetical protein